MLDLGIAAFGNDLVAAWKGTGTDYGLYYSSFNGSSWAPPTQIPGVGSSWGPSLAVFNGRLYAAWKGTDAGNALWYSWFDGSSWAPQTQIPGVGSAIGPSLAVFNGRLYAAWKGTDAGNALWYSWFDGSSWAPQTNIPGVGSAYGPSLAEWNGRLYAAWRGAGADEQLWYSWFDGSSWAPQTQVPVGLGSSIGPPLRVGFGNRLYLAYKGADTDTNIGYTSFDGSTWAPAARLSTGPGTTIGPSLTVFNNKLYAAWTGSDGDQQLWYSSFDGSSWAVPGGLHPLNLRTVVSSGAMLNVGNADLSSLTSGLVTGVPAANDGVIGPSTEEGFWSQPGLGSCEHTVTVNTHIDAYWNSGHSWTSSQLQDALADALGAVMQTVANKTAYQVYSYTLAFGGINAPDICVDPQPSTSGHYIPPEIQITAYDNGGATIGQVTVTYSTEDQSGESACGIIQTLGDGLQIFPWTSPLGAIVGTGTSLVCS
jgi:hypothetical protein